MDEISSLISTTYSPFTDIIPSNYSSTTEALHNVSKCDLPVKATLEVILYCTFMVFILFTSVVGNGVVIISVLLSKKLKGRSTFYFVGSLGKYLHTCTWLFILCDEVILFIFFCHFLLSSFLLFTIIYETFYFFYFFKCLYPYFLENFLLLSYQCFFKSLFHSFLIFAFR